MVFSFFIKIIQLAHLIGIFKPNNNPRLFDSITSVYKFLDKSEAFCIKYILNRKCEICLFSLNIDEFYKSYISVTLEKFNKIKNLDVKIESLFYINDCVCPKCGINLSTNKLDIKTLKDNSSFKTICTNIIYTEILIFNFDLEI